MIEKETTEEIMIQGQLWDNQRRKVNFYQSERQLNKVWVSMDSLIPLIKDICNLSEGEFGTDLLKELVFKVRSENE